MNDKKELAVKIIDVTKQYKLGQIGGGSLQADLQSWWAKVRGKEDPNSKIGAKQRLVGQTFMALNGIDLEIYKGEAIGIIGGNGAGKSTLLKLLSRVTAPTSGKIQIWGRVASMLEVGTGFNMEMTGRENIYMNGAILGMSKAEIESKMEDIIEFSEVREFIDTPVKRYSSGMYVKLAFSVAAHLDSEIMIMDEVLAVGDMAFQKKCLDKMRDVAKKEGRTVLYVSHNMNTIRQLCDRCVVLESGKVVYSGTVEESIQMYLGSNYKVTSDYLFSTSDHISKGTKDVVFRRVTLIDGNTSFRQGALIEIELLLAVRKATNKVLLRFEITTINGDLVGSMFSDKTIDFFDEGERKVRIAIDTSHLVVGRYKVDFIMYTQGVTGKEFFVDGVYPGAIFDISEQDNTLPWLHKKWGNTELHNINIIDCM